MNNISFQGRTNLVFDKKAYDNIVIKYHIRKYSNLTTTNKDMINLINSKYCTLDPNETRETVVLLVNGKGGMFFRKAKNQINEILDSVDKLKKTAKDKLTAWIISSENNENSVKGFDKVAEVLCDRPDIDTSILAFNKKDIVPNITFYPRAKELDVQISTPMNCNNQNPKLEEFFDLVELNNVV